MMMSVTGSMGVSTRALMHKMSMFSDKGKRLLRLSFVIIQRRGSFSGAERNFE